MMVSCFFLILVGCAQNQPTPQSQEEDWPDWVLNPTVEDGLADTACVSWSNDPNVDKAEAVANARVGIAKQISVKVKAMDKIYQKKVTSAGKANAESSFEGVAKSVTEASLQASRPIKVKKVMMGGEPKLCVMVAMGQAQKLFKDILKEANSDVNENVEKEMYLEWRASKAQAELAESTKK